MRTENTKQLRITLVMALLLAVLLVPAAHAQDVMHKYPIPGHGQLVLSVSPDWKEDVRQPKGQFPPTIYFLAKNGLDFEVSLIVGWNMADDPNFSKPERVRSAVEQSGKPLLAGAVEPKLVIQELTGGKGYYFSLTDKEMKPQQYRYITQGMLILDELQIAFTILTNAPNPAGSKPFLQMLQNASHEPAPQKST